MATGGEKQPTFRTAHGAPPLSSFSFSCDTALSPTHTSCLQLACVLWFWRLFPGLLYCPALSTTARDCSGTLDSLSDMIRCLPYHLPAILTQRGHPVTGVNGLYIQCPPPKGHSCPGAGLIGDSGDPSPLLHQDFDVQPSLLCQPAQMVAPQNASRPHMLQGRMLQHD